MIDVSVNCVKVAVSRITLVQKEVYNKSIFEEGAKHRKAAVAVK